MQYTQFKFPHIVSLCFRQNSYLLFSVKLHNGFRFDTPTIPLYFRHLLCIWLKLQIWMVLKVFRKFVFTVWLKMIKGNWVLPVRTLKWNLKMPQGSKGTWSGVLRLLQHPLLADSAAISYIYISTMAFLLLSIHQCATPAKCQAH